MIKTKAINVMNPNPDKALVFFGMLGGISRYIHLRFMLDTTELTRLIEPAATAAVCAFAAMLGKEMYRWVKAAYVKFFVPWWKSRFNRKK